MAVTVIGPIPVTAAIFLHNVECLMKARIDASSSWMRSSIAR
jgi:hypothetical protein